MTVPSSAVPSGEPHQKAASPSGRSRRGQARTSVLAHGEPSVWMMGGGLAFACFMIFILLGLIFVVGFGTFWPAPLLEVQTADGKSYLGEVTREERVSPRARGL